MNPSVAPPDRGTRRARDSRNAVRVSAAGHGYELDSAAVARDGRRAGLPPIVNIVLAIAAATIWLVALPAALDKPTPNRPCEAAILVDGKVKCVVDWLSGARPVPAVADPGPSSTA